MAERTDCAYKMGPGDARSEGSSQIRNLSPSIKEANVVLGDFSFFLHKTHTGNWRVIGTQGTEDTK